MLMIILAFRDIKADTFHPPMFTPHQNVAIREIESAVNTTQHNQDTPAWIKYPEDFELWNLGMWDSADGAFHLDTKPRQLLVLSTLKRNA